MAVVRIVQYKCDACGEYVSQQDVTVVRVGTVDDRPEDCERLDIGGACMSLPLTEILRRPAAEPVNDPG